MLSLLVLGLLPASALAASCDACGADATYSEAITTSGSYQKRTITATGCPNHYSYCVGKGSDGVPGCGTGSGEGTKSEAKTQSHSIEIPASPVIATSTKSVACTANTIAIALNGVSIYSGWVGGSCDLLDVTSSAAEWTSFDYCSGHSTGGPNGGDYHYHFPPSCLIDQANSTNPTSDGHSPQVGWSFDGFPIYGPLGPGGNTMSFTANGCTGDYCLDECSGQEKEISGLDNFKYRYYMTGAVSDLYTLPGTPMPAATDYPFTIKCYKGCTWSELSGGDSKCTGGSTGVTGSYSAAATTGYATKYLSSASGAASMLCGASPSASPSPSPSVAPSPSPSVSPSPSPSVSPSPSPSVSPSPSPSVSPSPSPVQASTSKRSAASLPTGMAGAGALLLLFFQPMIPYTCF